jgi:ArsR family transcriptional regulator, arsenate/arsenite/antimonite-responsive transcriptional repressor
LIDPCQYVLVEMVQALAECCGPELVKAPLSREEAERLAEEVRVLADPARLQVLSLIAARPDGEACVCHLTEPLGLSQPTVSHHLKVLSDAGLLERDQRGRWAYYRLRSDRLRRLHQAITSPALA